MSSEAPKKPGPQSENEVNVAEYAAELELFRQQQADYLQVSIEELHEMGDDAIARRVDELYGQDLAA